MGIVVMHLPQLHIGMNEFTVFDEANGTYQTEVSPGSSTGWVAQ